ncbi:MAG: hypothetical protein IH946_01705 [Bacteroidetes bacterium]|nr:hypothetical protein [Bacteroidota bacterium]
MKYFKIMEIIWLVLGIISSIAAAYKFIIVGEPKTEDYSILAVVVLCFAMYAYRRKRRKQLDSEPDQ